MSVRVIRIDDLDPNDPRRWTKPTGNDVYAGLCARLWDNGLIAADLGEWLRVNKKRCGKRPSGPSEAEVKSNYGRWLPRTIHVCSNKDVHAPTKAKQNYGCWKRKVDDSGSFLTNDRAPKRRWMGIYPFAAAPSPLGCSCCGITHWKRLCPNPVQRSSVTEPKSAVRTGNSSFQT